MIEASGGWPVSRWTGRVTWEDCNKAVGKEDLADQHEGSARLHAGKVGELQP